MTPPLISVIIPCYNQAQYLESSIESIRLQKFEDWEIIIINDGSTDNTQEVAELYANQDSRIRIIKQENKGLSAARNRGIKSALGSILHYLDADDKHLTGSISTVVKYFNEDSKIEVLVSSYSYFKGEVYFHSHLFDENILGLESFLSSNIAPPVSFFIKKSCQEQIGLFDETLKSCEDWDFWIRAAKAGSLIKTIPDVLVGYRYVPNSMSRNAVQMYLALKEVSFRAGIKDPRIASELPFNKDYPIDVEENLKYHLLRCLGVYLMQGNVSESVNWFLEEKEKWNWNIQMKDFEWMNSNLSFRYFLQKQEIEQLLTDTVPDFERFLFGIGLDATERKMAVKRIFSPQLKKRNHYRYGKWIGALVNRLIF